MIFIKWLTKQSFVRIGFLYILIVTSCTKSNDIIVFKMSFDQTITVPGGLNTIETYNFLIRDISTNYKNLLSTLNVKETD